MKGRTLFVGLVALSAILASTGARYQARRRAELTRQLGSALSLDNKPRAIQLLKLGANPNAKGHDGIPLVFGALDIESPALLKAFITAGVDVNTTSTEEGRVRTLLSSVGHYAEVLYPAQIEEMKLLLDAGANPNLGPESVIQANMGGCGHCGACWSNPRQVALLLKHGAKLRKGDTAAILEAALYDDVGEEKDSGTAMIRLWLKLPVPVKERRPAIANTIHELARYNSAGHNNKTIALLKNEMR
ncbi:hypothetical protein EON83_15280 [bacterium]|nr:MAG: hypothetical protein EON83_15280 [bacterium]